MKKITYYSIEKKLAYILTICIFTVKNFYIYGIIFAYLIHGVNLKNRFLFYS
jgi:hypothetical protein